MLDFIVSSWDKGAWALLFYVPFFIFVVLKELRNKRN